MVFWLKMRTVWSWQSEVKLKFILTRNPAIQFILSSFCKLHCLKSVRIRSYSVRMRENADQNNSEYGHFLRSVGRNWTLTPIYNLSIRLPKVVRIISQSPHTGVKEHAKLKTSTLFQLHRVMVHLPITYIWLNEIKYAVNAYSEQFVRRGRYKHV